MKTTRYTPALAALLSLPILFMAASTASAGDRSCNPAGCWPHGQGAHVAVVFRGPIPLPIPVIVTGNGPDCRDRREVRHERRHTRQIARHDRHYARQVARHDRHESRQYARNDRHERRYDRRDARRASRYEDSRWRDTGHRW